MTLVPSGSYRRASGALLFPALVLLTWGELSPRIHIAVPWDKGVHAAAYFALGALVTLACDADWRAIAGTAGLIVLGVTLEILQRWTGRDPSVADAISNAIGAGAGWCAATALVRHAAEADMPDYFLVPVPAHAAGTEGERVLLGKSELPTKALHAIASELRDADVTGEVSGDMGWELEQ